MLIRSFIFILLFSIPFSFLFAQNENNKFFFIITKDGIEYIGNVEVETDIDITLRLHNKEIVVVPKTNVKIYEPVTEDNFLRGKYVHPNRFANRYLLGTSVIPPGKNQFCFSTIYGSAWNLDYGINDIYSVGMSSTIVGTPVMLNAQGNYKIGDQFYFGATATAGWMSWVDPTVFFGYGGIKLTNGSRSNNYTISGGYFSLSSSANLGTSMPNNVSLGDFGYVNFSGMKRYTKNIYGNSEVWIFKSLYLRQSVYLINVGMKVIRHEKAAWSFFISTLVFHQLRNNKIQVIPIPGIAWSRKFGK
jgi:hypothetical protein